MNVKRIELVEENYIPPKAKRPKTMYRIYCAKTFETVDGTEILEGTEGGLIANPDIVSDEGRWWIDDKSFVFAPAVIIKDDVIITNSVITETYDGKGCKFTISGFATITDSVIRNSNISGYSEITKSEVSKSAISGNPIIRNSKLAQCDISDEIKCVLSQLECITLCDQTNVYRSTLKGKIDDGPRAIIRLDSYIVGLETSLATGRKYRIKWESVK